MKGKNMGSQGITKTERREQDRMEENPEDEQ